MTGHLNNLTDVRTLAEPRVLTRGLWLLTESTSSTFVAVSTGASGGKQ